MAFYSLDPDVAGGFGPGTVLDTTVHPPDVKKLHYVFEGWDGDVVVQTFPCYLVTEEVRDSLVNMGATGLGFDSVEVETSDEFGQLYPEISLPPFVRLLPKGAPGVDDVGFGANFHLIISQRVFDLFSEKGIPNALLKTVES